MVITEELWEIMQQDQKHPQCALNNKQGDISDKRRIRLLQTAKCVITIQSYSICTCGLYLVEDLHRFVELYVPQEGSQILKEVDQQLCVHGPTLKEVRHHYLISDR